MDWGLNYRFPCSIFYLSGGIESPQAETGGKVAAPLAGTLVGPVASVQRLKVAVILPDLETDDPVLEAAAKTIQDTLVLNLMLSGRYSVDRIDFLAPAKDFAKARGYFVDKNYDGAIWGLLGRRNDGIRIRLSAWKRGEQIPGVEEAADGVAALGIFDVADHLTHAVLERFTGTRMALGTLRFRPSGDPIDYRVSVNGEFAGQGVETLKVPATTLRVRISAVVNGREYPQDEVLVSVPEDQEVEFPFHLQVPKVQPAPVQEATNTAVGRLSNDSTLQLIKLLDQRAFRNKGRIPEIQSLATQLRDEDKRYFYDKYSLSWAIFPALGNTFYGIGSWFQGDHLGGLWCSGCMVGGAGLMSNSSQDHNSLGWKVGITSVVVGMVSGWIIPFLFQSNNNSNLKTALQYYP